MSLKNKIVAAAMCALVAGIGIFNLGSGVANAENATSTASAGSTLSFEQMQQMIDDLRVQIQQLIQIISEKINLAKQNNGQAVSICAKTMPKAPTDSEKTQCAAAGGVINSTTTCETGANASSTDCTVKYKCDCANVCGNHKCEAGENEANCKRDCKKASLKGNTELCGSNSECASGYCSEYGTMCCNAGQCGWGDGANFARECVDNGKSKDNQWLNGICDNGAWKTRNGGKGCGTWTCAGGTCVDNQCSGTLSETKCIVYGDKCCKGDNCVTADLSCQLATSTMGIITKCDTDCKPVVACKIKTANSCLNDGECVSGNCSYGACCPVGDCGWGDGGAGGPRMCVADGSTQSNQWLAGVCRNQIWKTALNGIGCPSFACDQGSCVDNICKIAPVCGNKKCETGETATNCANDCKVVGGNCTYKYFPGTCVITSSGAAGASYKFTPSTTPDVSETFLDSSSKINPYYGTTSTSSLSASTTIDCILQVKTSGACTPIMVNFNADASNQ